MNDYMSPEEAERINAFLLEQANGARGAGSPMSVDDLVAALTGKLEKMQSGKGTLLSRALVGGGEKAVPTIANSVSARNSALDYLKAQ